MTDYSVARDRWGRPYVTQNGETLKYDKGRRTPNNATAYSRISTLAGALDDKSNLIDWTAARAMIGLVKSESLFAQVAHLASAHRDPWAVPEAKKPLKELVQRATDLGGASDASGDGTAFHGLAEVWDKTGIRPEFMPRRLEPWIEARQEALQDWEPVLVEPFVVIDEIQIAGSPDRFLRHKKTGIVVCADDKSGASDPDYPLKVTIQVAAASRGEQYDQRTGKRTRIDCDQDVGLLIHTPIRSTGNPRSTVYSLDLQAGWKYAKLAVEVREARKFPKLLKA